MSVSQKSTKGVKFLPGGGGLVDNQAHIFFVLDGLEHLHRLGVSMVPTEQQAVLLIALLSPDAAIDHNGLELHGYRVGVGIYSDFLEGRDHRLSYVDLYLAKVLELSFQKFKAKESVSDFTCRLRIKVACL